MRSYALFAITMAACEWGPQYCEGDWAAVPPEAEPQKATVRTVAQVLPTDSSAVDILFVIDDSGSMTDEQAQLGIWSTKLFEVLSGVSGELPDLHLAVTSSSVAIPNIEGCRNGNGGRLRSGTAMLDPRSTFIRDVAGPDGRDRNYTGTLSDTFAQMAQVGDSGCGFEQPMKAARLALSGGSAFLRDDALLLVVFVTDEDDCSADSTMFSDLYGDACSGLGTLTSYRCFEHGVRCHDGKGSREFGERRDCRPAESTGFVDSVSDFAEFLKALKANPAQVLVAAIYGKPNGVNVIPDERVTTHTTPRLASVCGAGPEGRGATPAIRLNALLAEFGGRAAQSSICESELSWAMRDIGDVTLRAATRSHCLHGPLIDTDRAAPGIQPACRVRVDLVDDLSRSIELPACDVAGGTRCFTLGRDPACSDTETQLAFQVSGTASNETLSIACEIED